MDAVTAVGSAFHHLVQEDDALAFFPNLHAEIAEAGQSLGQPGQLVVVRREQRQRLQLRGIVQVLENGLRDAHPVIRAGPSPHLVEEQQAPGGCVDQDVCGLHHLHHEGG